MNIKEEIIALEVAHLCDPLSSEEGKLEDFRVLACKVVYGTVDEMTAFYLEHGEKTPAQILTAMNDFQALRREAEEA